ncbi:hypothetical protein QBC38DRAFT_482131 [Podospora fimiseda]|uniref:Secreted protein n=1 Tax=Podospora fimiseda TaxID=252190 RepID=A0AAN7BLF1_9PEZI|nr:hypothetical protein QBC38DRAFT_482131 [Podospora fimiseda]
MFHLFFLFPFSLFPFFLPFSLNGTCVAAYRGLRFRTIVCRVDGLVLYDAIGRIALSATMKMRPMHPHAAQP